MSKLYILFGLILGGGVIWWMQTTGGQVVTPSAVRETASPTPMVSFDQINWKGQKYAVITKKVADPGKLRLIDNLVTKSAVKQLVEEQQCVGGINGGFYDKQDRPLGLMISGGTKISGWLESDFFDGVVWVRSNGTWGISKVTTAREAVQSGPMLYINSWPTKLTLRQDRWARRMVFVKTKQGEAVLVAVFDEDDLFSGPKLADLPEIVGAIGKEYQITIQEAINLDGGTASAIYTPGQQLTEFNRVGSWWCEVY